eukprot:6214462-Pleurochrysis_carterae.AAC.3
MLTASIVVKAKVKVKLRVVHLLSTTSKQSDLPVTYTQFNAAAEPEARALWHVPLSVGGRPGDGGAAIADISLQADIDHLLADWFYLNRVRERYTYLKQRPQTELFR